MARYAKYAEVTAGMMLGMAILAALLGEWWAIPVCLVFALMIKLTNVGVPSSYEDIIGKERARQLRNSDRFIPKHIQEDVQEAARLRQSRMIVQSWLPWKVQGLSHRDIMPIAELGVFDKEINDRDLLVQKVFTLEDRNRVKETDDFTKLLVEYLLTKFIATGNASILEILSQLPKTSCAENPLPWQEWSEKAMSVVACSFTN